jgi:hypothetical protein
MLCLEHPSIRTLLLSWAYRNGPNASLCLALINSTLEVCKKISTSKMFGFWLHSTPETRHRLAIKPGQPRNLAWSTATAVVRSATCLVPSFLSTTLGAPPPAFLSPPPLTTRRRVFRTDTMWSTATTLV